MSLINPSLEVVYCSNLASDYSQISSLDSSRHLQTAVAMRFLFCLDLSLHEDAGKKFGILNFVIKHGVGFLLSSYSTLGVLCCMSKKNFGSKLEKNRGWPCLCLIPLQYQYGTACSCGSSSGTSSCITKPHWLFLTCASPLTCLFCLGASATLLYY